MQNVPEQAPSAPAEAGSPLAQLWRNIWPWDDLNAKGPPERWLSLGTEILPALAVLAAQGPDKPRLLQTDLLARLLTVGSLNAVDKAAAAAAAGQNVITVNNPNLFAPGSWVAIVPAAGAATLTNSQFYQVLGPGNVAGTLTIAPNLATAVNPGDYIVSVPAVWIAGQSLNVQVGNSVNIGTLPPITIAAAQSVNIGGSVAVGSLPPITIAAAQNVGITGTVNVSITSGSVTIAGTPNINIQSQSVTVTVGQQWASAGTSVINAAGAGAFLTTIAVGALAQQFQMFTAAGVAFNTLVIKGHQSGTTYVSLGATNPVTGVIFPIIGTLDTTFDISWSSITGALPATLLTFWTSLPFTPQPGQTWNQLSIPVSIAADQVFDNGAFTGFRGLETQPMFPTSQAVSTPAPGTNASITFAATPSIRWIVQRYSAALVQTGATGGSGSATVTDAGVTIQNDGPGVDGVAAHTDRIEAKPGIGNGATNRALGFTVSVPNAGVAAVLNVVVVQR